MSPCARIDRTLVYIRNNQMQSLVEQNASRNQSSQSIFTKTGSFNKSLSPPSRANMMRDMEAIQASDGSFGDLNSAQG